MSNFMTPNTSTDCTHIDELSAMRNSSSPERKRARPTTDVTKTLLVDRTNTLSTHGREKAAELSQAVQEPVTTSSTPESAHRRRRLAGSGNDGAVTRGAWTKLTSIAQLEQLLHSQLLSIDTPAHQHLRFHSSAGKKGGKVSGELEQSAAPLALRAGETILIVLHKSADGLPPPEITADTESFSQLRVFSLNLATLPTLEYAGDASPQADSSNAVESSSAPPTSPPPATVDHVRAGDGEEEEEDTIIVTPATPVVVHRGTAPTREQTTPSSPTRHSTLSHCLSHAFDVVLERLRGLLRVSSLPPSTQTDESGNSTIPVPGLVLWRAGGAPETHYSPFPSASNTAPSVELQREQAAAVGGPLSMKLLNANNQVHSLSLYQQVYTMEGFMNTVYQSLPDVVEKAGKSHTIVYIGASWCPPCMRIVGKFAHLLQASMPTSVHCLVKADMDYAKDVVDFFGVEIVPTFIILDNQQLPKRHRVEEEQAAGGDGWKATVKSAVLGSLQNSDESTVALFFDKHCTGIQFDEDF